MHTGYRHSQLKQDKQLLESIPAIGDKTSDALLSILQSQFLPKSA